MLKTVSSIANAIGALNYVGTWDAATNNPTLTSGVGVKGDYYVVSVAGTTDLDGNDFWGVGDMAVFNGAVWQRVEGGANSDVEKLIFNTSPGNLTPSVAEMTWDNDNGSVILGLKGGNVTLELGQENLAYCHNNSGSPIAKGKVVSVTGSQGQRPTIDLSSATSEALSADTIGVTSEAIANGADGFIATFGVVGGINTYGLTEGLAIYLATTAGGLTTTRPTAPNQTVAIGWCVRESNSPSGNDGQIFVNINNGWELEELHNVLITSPANNQVLVYNTPTNVWINSSNVILSNITGANVTVTANLYANLATSNTAAMPDPSLPLNPEGYISVVINGATKKIPYYGV